MKKIAIHSVPRSGSTWLGSMFDSCPNVKYAYQPLFSYKFKNQLTIDSTYDDIKEFYEGLLKTDDSFVCQAEAKESGIVPEFNKAIIDSVVYKEVRYHHLLENMLTKDNDLIVVGLIRNPLSVVNSWLNAEKEFRADLGWKIEDEWLNAPKKNLDKIEEYNGYIKWVEVTYSMLMLQEKFPKQFYLQDYSDLLNDTKSEVEKMFNFCGLEVSSQTNTFLVKSTSINSSSSYSVFKSKKTDNGWQDKLPQFIVDYITNDTDFIKLNKIFKWL